MNQQENLALEFQEWLDEVKRGKKGYEFIHLGPQRSIYRSSGFSGPITTAVCCIWDSKGNVSRYEWYSDDLSTEIGEMTVILRKRKKLILANTTIGYRIFGTESTKGEEVIRASIYLQCGGIATFITVSSDLPEIQVIDYVLSYSGNDPLQVVLQDLLTHLKDYAQKKEETDRAATD